MNYQPQPEDVRAVLEQALDLPALLGTLPVFTEADAGLMQQVLEEAGKFVGEVIAPLNRTGDETGAQWHHGMVTMPAGFRDAYQQFWQAGWPALSAAPEDGGQGLPAVLECVLYEWMSAANHGFTMAPGLLHGAYECLKHHGSAELKARYLGRIATGEWLATMCLTEPHAGSDLGLVHTRAVPQADGSHRLSGTKIFISGGEHDLTDNIVHLVLARLPDAPPGPKGLSLFLVPKFYEDGQRSRVHCDRIEEKMGLHGSPTCVMRFDEATAWMVGEPGKGLNAIFVMMNAARLHVALQGIGLLDAAWQKADAYARERRQMRAPGSAARAGDADLIDAHPAVRRILDTQRAWVDGGRVIAYRTGAELDLARHHPDPQRREQAQRWCAFVTPVLKAAWTEQAFHGASDCLQVLGGHGYVREWGIEQIVRDSRVAMIYEGTNEIQAIDLLIRKTLPDGGAAMRAWTGDLLADLDTGAGNSRFARATQQLCKDLGDAVAALVAAHARDAAAPYWVASDFLRLTALTLLAWAAARLEAGRGTRPDAPAEQRWNASLQALHDWVLPEAVLRLQMLRQRCDAAGNA